MLTTQISLQIGGFDAESGRRRSRLSPRDHARLRTESGLRDWEQADLAYELARDISAVLVSVMDITIMSRAPPCERRSSVSTRGEEIPAKRTIQAEARCPGAAACYRARGPVVEPARRACSTNRPDLARS